MEISFIFVNQAILINDILAECFVVCWVDKQETDDNNHERTEHLLLMLTDGCKVEDVYVYM